VSDRHSKLWGELFDSATPVVDAANRPYPRATYFTCGEARSIRCAFATTVEQIIQAKVAEAKQPPAPLTEAPEG
jgi:hypothetical protein